MACNTNSLSGKIVINICDARKLGHICNYELDLCDGRITAVFVPGDGGFLGFGRSGDIRIPWDCIKKIGEDAILVELALRPADCASPPKKRRFF
ncbi:MAG: YlmC/YmxH family sporulation protein [Clostridia bacterium]|nr:YlmC/YmxH family sporulation protein [Clostridia bacterium]